MSKKFTLGSFLEHPQIKTNHANKESEKLTNHDTSGASEPAQAGTGGPSTAAQGTTAVNVDAASKISKSFTDAHGTGAHK